MTCWVWSGQSGAGVPQLGRPEERAAFRPEVPKPGNDADWRG